ncbi:30S ribosomal protein S24e [uncultured archaeon]|nr:30S ribosomal protein S24e [uncultured archaeon]
MQTEIVSKTENKLLGRTEIDAVISFDGKTPGRKEIRESVSTKIGLNPDLTVLRSVESQFGMNKIAVTAHSYADKEKLMKTEPKHILVRDGFATKEEKKAKAKAVVKSQPPPK